MFRNANLLILFVALGTLACKPRREQGSTAQSSGLSSNAVNEGITALNQGLDSFFGYLEKNDHAQEGMGKSLSRFLKALATDQVDQVFPKLFRTSGTALA